MLMDVNVGGTKNMIDMCLKHPECRKMVYVSSTGAIPELPKGTPIRETHQFTPVDESRQVGCYSQSKALATQAVLDAFRERGLKACVVHPSGILGPKDYAVGETTGTVIKIMNGKMPIGMGGSFHLCDVRDLAHGCIGAADKGRDGGNPNQRLLRSGKADSFDSLSGSVGSPVVGRYWSEFSGFAMPSECVAI